MAKLQLNIMQPRAKSKTGDPAIISVSKTTTTFGAEVLRTMGLQQGDYVMVADFGKDLYFAKRPAGLPGYKLAKMNETAKRLTISSTELQGKFEGKWELGEVVEQSMALPDHTKVLVRWYKALKSQSV